MSKIKCVSMLKRKLKEGQTYKDFHNAWLPPGVDANAPDSKPKNYFPDAVQVINAVNIEDPTEIISIGLIPAELSDVMEVIPTIMETEKQRHDAIEAVADFIENNTLYQVMEVQELGHQTLADFDPDKTD